MQKTAQIGLSGPETMLPGCPSAGLQRIESLASLGKATDGRPLINIWLLKKKAV
jgi:hypothetical protein